MVAAAWETFEKRREEGREEESFAVGLLSLAEAKMPGRTT